jgi:hypothetical protein
MRWEVVGKDIAETELYRFTRMQCGYFVHEIEQLRTLACCHAAVIHAP